MSPEELVEWVSEHIEDPCDAARLRHLFAGKRLVAIQPAPVIESREHFEDWYRNNIDPDADFQIGREYEDTEVYAAWSAWRHVARLLDQPSPVSNLVVDDLAALVGRLAHALKNVKPDHRLATGALDYLKRKGLEGSPLRMTEMETVSQPADAQIGGLIGALVDACHKRDKAGFTNKFDIMKAGEDIRAYVATLTKSQSNEPCAYACPADCGCLWRDNGDNTMSLFSGKHSSCATCEFLPLRDLMPLYAGGEQIQALRDMLDDARLHLEMLREALGVPVEPHQVLHERMLEAARTATLTKGDSHD